MKKFLYKPLKYWKINQHFGQNSACMALEGTEGTKYIWCDGNNPPTGYRSIYGKEGHRGIDLRAGMWTPIYAARDGKVVFIDKNEKSGYDVRIESVIDGDTWTHIYEHMVKWNVEEGDDVATGQVIGWVGTTGYSTGPHLHFELRDKYGISHDPLLYMNDDFAGTIFLLSNTVKGLQQKVFVLATQIADFLNTKKISTGYKG